VIELSVTDRIATLTLCQPPVNAISDAWLVLMDEALDGLAVRDDWQVLLIRSNQKVFCAGADLNEVADRIHAADGADRTLAYVVSIQRVFARIEALPQVSLAEIGGAAIGGGLELTLACDLRIAADEAKLGLPEARLGLLPGGGGTQRLTRICGRAVASRLILGAEIVDGRAAVDLGIANWSAPRAEVPARAMEIAARIAELPASALAACKTCIAAACEPGHGGFSDEQEYTRRLLTDPETRRRVEAFLAGNQ